MIAATKRACVVMSLLLVALSALSAPPTKAKTSKTASARPAVQKPVVQKWELKLTENFNGKTFNPNLWKRIVGQADAGADWQRNISDREDLVTLKDGILTLKGVRNDDTSADARRVLAGGISTQGLFAMKYGKIEARIRIKGCKGAWPALWMMPSNSRESWPLCGEIDIFERLNLDPFVYQTVHSAWAESHPNDPPRGGKGAIKASAWNVYALEWTPEKLVWRINGKETHSYAKTDDSEERWPWTVPFFLMIDMQLGGQWVGPVDEAALPVQMQVDWVKLYHLVRNGKRVSEFSRPD